MLETDAPELSVQTLSTPARLWRCFRPLLIGSLIGGLLFWAAQQLLEDHENLAVYLFLVCGVGPLVGLMMTVVALVGHWHKLLESAARTPLRRIAFGLLFALGAVGVMSLSTWVFLLADEGYDRRGEIIILAVIITMPGFGLALSALALLWKPTSLWIEEVTPVAEPAPLVHRGNPSRSIARGWVIHILGILILVGGAAFAFYLWRWTYQAQWPGFVRLLLMMVVGLGSYFFGQHLIDSACRLRALCAKQIMEEDPRPPILFLRSFTEDGADPAIHGVVSSRMSGRQGILFLFEIWRILRGKDSMTFEEELACWFGKHGPFVSIGKPGEELATLGASRLYVDHHQWQEKVSELVNSARWIVWQAGQTPGTWWELETLLLHVPPGKVLLIAPHDLGQDPADSIWRKDLTGVESIPRDNSVREQFIARAKELLPRPLPVMRPSDRLIMFDDEWNATTHPLVIRSWLGQQFHDSIIDLDATFRPFVSPSRIATPI